MPTTPLSDLLKLPAEERLELLEALWESLSREPNAVPMPDWHRDVLLERDKSEDSDLGDTWEIVKARLERPS